MIALFIASGVWNEFALGFGAAAALLTIGGMVVLRFQRNRYEYALMRMALESGTNAFPFAQPPWLVSRRQGLMTFTLGIGLLGVGITAWRLSDCLESPTLPTTQPVAATDLLAGPKPRDESGRLKPEGRLYSLARKQWEQSQALRLGGLAMAGSGAIMILLGTVRIAFSRVERRHTT